MDSILTTEESKVSLYTMFLITKKEIKRKLVRKIIILMSGNAILIDTHYYPLFKTILRDFYTEHYKDPANN